MADEDDEFMIQCDAPGCGKWYDVIDLNPPLDPITASQYEIWHCEHCIPYHGPSQHRRRRDGLRKRKRINFVKLNDPGSFSDSENGHNIGLLATNDIQDVDFGGLIRQRKSRGVFKRGRAGCLLKLAKGEEFNATYVAKHGFNRPVLFANKTPSQLGLRVPASSDVDGAPFTYATVAKLVGPFRPIQVIDTATQLTTEYTLHEWVNYLESPAEDRTRILNAITLEFSQTPLGRLVTEPQFARDVDFVHLHWPKTLEDVGQTSLSSKKIEELPSSTEDILYQLEKLKKEQPRVTKYCLMSAAGSYTDFHIDFGGTAVWYHVYYGSKVFYFIEPSPKNIKIYSKWATNASGTKTKTYKFLPDLILAAGGNVYEVALRKGQTLFIPSGWIHAVYTPDDSLVFGGNFVHRHSLEMQLNIYRLERQMKVGKDFRFPNYQKLMWYSARDFLEECHGLQPRQPKEGTDNDFVDDRNSEQRQMQMICATYSPHILKGYKALAKELERWSTSKIKLTIQQYPENMNVQALSSQLGEMMKQCVAYIDKEQKEQLRVMRK
mmetsp:Transcript_37093/g.66821  ORF Transcript_37093/g.66821 Transcript_37093/m.66821 type:complete len:549 (-) Transcript_37093:289-1935(-)|eukprot:CAMPEP_0201867442 /NCGR_PEP_ID=MMETSP0902-20130614/1667_1 /ASSEMBLY_ACC=CAM_ASM_000551 /TAXON_ID=420261 /ORGANISM="Thalassiosira antarctica, Strain CCMP982" /LENGTH=548 /DNA_ID=CAMNT_0048392591 /DNA_START=20 /DNA_END=1666 /DNA_ORIENTATION=+